MGDFGWLNEFYKMGKPKMLQDVIHNDKSYWRKLFILYGLLCLQCKQSYTTGCFLLFS